MALTPKIFKYTKYSKSRVSKIPVKKELYFGDIGLQAAEAGRLSPRQVQAARRVIRKCIKPFKGIVRTKIRAYLPITTKPLSVRMGRGKGRVSFAVCPIRQGDFIFHILCKNAEASFRALKQASSKLPIHTRCINQYKD